MVPDYKHSGDWASACRIVEIMETKKSANKGRTTAHGYAHEKRCAGKAE